jgi:hypothetical protein
MHAFQAGHGAKPVQSHVEADQTYHLQSGWLTNVKLYPTSLKANYRPSPKLLSFSLLGRFQLGLF